MGRLAANFLCVKSLSVLVLLLVGAHLHAAGPTMVSIVNPTTNRLYFDTDTITAVAEALAPDGAITNVQIFLGANPVGTCTNTPCFVMLTNLPPSTNAYSFSAIAIDDLGQQATSSAVSVIVEQSAPVAALGPIALNRQNGLFEHYVRISNPTPQSYPNGVRLFIANLGSTNRVWNATGTNASGVPYIEAPAPFPSGTSGNVLIQYYLPEPRSVPQPIFLAEPLPFTVPPPSRPVLAPVQRAGASIVVQFTTETDRLYYLQSSSDLAHWNTPPGLVFGNGGSVQTTNSSMTAQFFRVLMLP